jgi:hypothetical protein
MNIVEPKITISNLVNTIDRTVLNLRKVKKGDIFSKELKNQIIDILNFTFDSSVETYSDALYSKGVYIEKESLEILHNNFIVSDFSKEDLKNIISIVENLSNKDISEINKIQSLLVKISIPIWETKQQLANG